MSDTPGASERKPSDKPNDLTKLQFDYAWKWFAYHADQRIKMFNYMLVVFGIAAAGIVNALDQGKHIPPEAIAMLCFISSVVAIFFVLVDRRNRNLIWLGEDVLIHLERDDIFGTGKKIAGRKGKPVTLGLLWRQDAELNPQKVRQAPSAECRGQRSKLSIRSRLCDVSNYVRELFIDGWHGKHRVLLPTIGLLIALLFFIAGIWVLERGGAIHEKPSGQASTLKTVPAP